MDKTRTRIVANIVAIITLTCGVNAASAQAVDDAAAIQRGQAAVARMISYECPKPGSPLTIEGLGTDEQIRKVQAENLSYVQSRVTARNDALRARQVIATELRANQGRPSANLQKSFDSLDNSIKALDYRAANALVQFSLASLVQISNASSDYDVLSNAPHPLLQFVPLIRDVTQFSAQFGDVARPVPAKLQQCLIAAHDYYIELSAPLIREQAGRATKAGSLDSMLRQMNQFPVDPTLPGGQIFAEIQQKRVQLAAEEAREVEMARAQADKAARDKLSVEANRTLAIAQRYVAAINEGNTQEAYSLLADNVYLRSPKGDANGKAAVEARMRDVASKNSGARLLTPELTSNFQVVSRIYSNQGNGSMTLQTVGDKISRIQLQQ